MTDTSPEPKIGTVQTDADGRKWVKARQLGYDGWRAALTDAHFDMRIGKLSEENFRAMGYERKDESPPPVDASPAALFLLAYLAENDDAGWTVALDTPSKVRLVRGDDVIEYGYKFNGGDPMWFCTEAPERYTDSEEVRLPEPFRMAVRGSG